MKIGFLIIGTHKYSEYAMNIAKKLHTYVKIPNASIHCFIFTNRPYIREDKNDTIINIHHTPWPLPTLLRYHVFQQFQEYWEDMDYVYYIDADMDINTTIGSDILPSQNEELVATLHPGFFNKPHQYYTYDDNPHSNAFIDISHLVNNNYSPIYVAGGFNGGKTEQYKEMINTIVNWINKDLSNHYIARWHDESYLNKFINCFEYKTKILSPSYCYPEGSNIPFEPKIIALNKNHAEIRQ